MAKEGSTLSGIMDAFALSVSIALQYGVPLRAIVDKFVNSRFEPSGYTGNPEIRYAKSIVDYLGRWLGGSSSPATTSMPMWSKKRAAPAASAPAVASKAVVARESWRAGTGHPSACGHRRCAILLRMRHAHDAQRQLLQMRELRQHVGLQLDANSASAIKGRLRVSGALFIWSLLWTSWRNTLR